MRALLPGFVASFREAGIQIFLVVFSLALFARFCIDGHAASSALKRWSRARDEMKDGHVLIMSDLCNGTKGELFLIFFALLPCCCSVILRWKIGCFCLDLYARRKASCGWNCEELPCTHNRCELPFAEIEEKVTKSCWKRFVSNCQPLNRFIMEGWNLEW